MNTNKDLILSLIKAEMKSYKLIRCLDNAGALVEDFYADLDWSIMDLVGFEDEKDRERLFKVYDQFMEQLEEMPVRDFVQDLNDLAMQLYIALLNKKKTE